MAENPDTKIFRVRYQAVPNLPHVYIRFFVANGPDLTFAGLGNLTMTHADWAALQSMFRKSERITFIDDLKETDAA